MATLNLFKIDNNNKEKFLIENETADYKEIKFKEKTYKLYLKCNLESIPTTLSWGWVLSPFNKIFNNLVKMPMGLLFFEYLSNLFVFSFGSAFHKVDKYCDKNFAFSIAKKFKYKSIKSTSQIQPNSKVNKIINSYNNNTVLDYESGQAFLKLKGILDLSKGFSLFNNNIEIGTSLKIKIDQPSLEKLIEIVDFLEDLSNKEDITNIPLFYKITDDKEIEECEIIFKKNFDENNISFSFSDFDIIGTNEIFYSQNAQYKIMCGRNSSIVDTLSIQEIKRFCVQKNINLKENFDKIYISAINSNIFKTSLKELIDYNIDEKKCVLIKGEWYKYNDDYLIALEQSLNDLNCVHDKRFDWYKFDYDNYINEKLQDFKNQKGYIDLKNDEERKNKLVKVFYNERVYNVIKHKELGLELGDRKNLILPNNSKIEIDDMHNNDSLFAVKIGDSSSKLCFVVNQMSIAMKAIRDQKIAYDKSKKNLFIVLIIKYQDSFPKENCSFNFNKIKLLALKQSIDEWQKNARKQNFNPKVIIGYNYNE